MTSRRAVAATPSRPAVALAFAGLYALVVVLTVFRVSTDDVWIHLKTGEQIVKTGHVPRQDVYSFTATDHDYVAHEWLAAVLFYAVHAAAGVTGLILFKHAVVGLTVAVLFLVARVRGDHLAPWAFALMLMLFVASARFLERPHIFSYLFTSVYLLAYFAYRERGQRRALCALPLLHVLWANLHGGHLTGVALLAALALAEAATSLRARVWGPRPVDRPLPARELAVLAALPFACLAAALVNPYGVRLLTFPFELTSLQVFMRGELGIVEWQTLLHPVYTSTAMYLFFIFWVGLLLVVLSAAGDDGPVPPRWRAPVQALQLVTSVAALVFLYELAHAYGNPQTPTSLEVHAGVWCAIAALWGAARLHRLPLVDLAVTLLFLALAFRHNRAVTDAVVATLPVVAHGLSRLWDRWAKTPPPPILIPAAGLVAAGLAVWTAFAGYHFGFDPPSVRAGGLGIGDHLPVAAVDYLVRNRVSGRVLNSYDAGGLLIHRLWPAVHVAMDSRNDVYGENLYREYRDAFEGGPALARYLEKWAVDVVVVTNTVQPPLPFLSYLEYSDGWAMIYQDPRTLVYVRRNERFRELIARDEPPLLNPGVPMPGASQPVR